MSKTLFVLIVVLAIALLWVSVLHSQPAREQPSIPLKGFMAQKLRHSQALLEGIVMEDYQQIARHGQALSLLSLESGWQVLQTDQYNQLSKSFRSSVDRLTVAGREKNVDAAVLAYMDMTMRCVQCHRYVRSNSGSIRVRR